MDAHMKELLSFLHDRNPQVRQIALANLLGHTPAGSPHRSVFFTELQGLDAHKDPELVRDLKLLCRDQLATAHDAFRALVNLSDSPLWVRPLAAPPFLAFLVSYILHPPSVLADLASMLLSNLTAQQPVCAALLALQIPVVEDASLGCGYYPPQSRCGTSPPPALSSSSAAPVDAHALPLLVDAFASSARAHPAPPGAGPPPRKGALHFLASVFANISTTPAGRLFFVTPRGARTEDLEFPLARLTPFTEHGDAIRRGGVAAVIKNCAFHAAAHRAMLAPADARVAVPPLPGAAPGVDALSAILLPLAGPEEFDPDDQERLPPALQLLPPSKRREPAGALRRTHVESLILLCTTRWGRDFLRAHGAYEVVRAMHETEPVDEVSEHIEHLVNFLKRDEAGDGDDDTIEEV